MVSPLKYVPSVPLAYLRDGDEGITELANRIEADAHARVGGKFGKRRARYLPQSPFLPILWRTSCGRCRFWEEGGPGTPGSCHIVGRADDPFGGEAIHYRGWCAFWTPPEGEPPFAWIGERLHPDGKSTIRGEYDAEPPVKEVQRRVDGATEPDRVTIEDGGEDGDE